MKTRSHKGMGKDLLDFSVYSQMAKAESALRVGEASACLKLVSLVIHADPDHVGALELMAKAQWQLNQFQGLLDTLTKLIRINPYEPGYQALRGTALRSLGRYGEAVRAFVRAGDAPGAREAVAELCAIQSEVILKLLSEDSVFRAEYKQNPEKACISRGFEFGSERKVRHHALLNECSAKSFLVRPS